MDKNQSDFREEAAVDSRHETYMKRCYELAVSAGKKGHDTFGAVLVHNGEILERAVVYTSCAPCERCLAAIASLGVHQIVCGVSYKEFCRLLPFGQVHQHINGNKSYQGVRESY